MTNNASNRWYERLDNSDVWIKGIEQWIRDGVTNGYEPFYVNFMFKPLYGSPKAIMAQMHDALENDFYSKYCTCFHRDPLSPKAQQYLPRLILIPDGPVPKDEKQTLRSLVFNDGGKHFNGPLLAPERSRFTGDVVKHIHRYQGRFSGERIERIHVTAIRDIERVADYAVKTLKRFRVDEADILILPRSPSELLIGPSLDLTTRRGKDIESSLNVSPELAMAISQAR